MNLNDLTYVLCIAKHQNITKAAQELYVSQPTLSKYLQRLENELNTKLFSRISNCYIPTYTGKRYLEYAEKMLSVHQDWEKELADLQNCRDGELNIAFPLMRSSCMIPSLLPLFHAEHPNIRINLLEETYAIQEKLLLDDQIDFAVFNESIPHPKLCYELLGKEEILIVLPPKHPIAVSCKKANDSSTSGYPSIDLPLLKDETFILHFPEQNTGKTALELFRQYGINPAVSFHTRNTQAALLLVQQGFGVCFAPETYIRGMSFESKLQCFSIGRTPVYSTVSIAYRKGMYLSSYARDFIQIAKSNWNLTPEG